MSYKVITKSSADHEVFCSDGNKCPPTPIQLKFIDTNYGRIVLPTGQFHISTKLETHTHKGARLVYERVTMGSDRKSLPTHRRLFTEHCHCLNMQCPSRSLGKLHLE